MPPPGRLDPSTPIGPRHGGPTGNALLNPNPRWPMWVAHPPAPATIDVTVKDIKHAAAEGYDSLELSKRYTTVTMGPSQGRFSQIPSARVLAARER